jgi:hypothetical protein
VPGSFGYKDDTAATSGTLNVPFDTVGDSAGNLYISDYGNSAIRIVTATTNIIYTIAGNGFCTKPGTGKSI